MSDWGSLIDAAGQDVLGNTKPFADAIASIESAGSGDYSALGPFTKRGDRAYGRYQVMGANIPQWTQEALGRSLTPQQFLADKAAQDAVFANKFGGYVKQYGNPQDAASAWFTGRPLAQGGNARDVLGASGNKYVDKFNAALPQQTAQAAPMLLGPTEKAPDFGALIDAAGQESAPQGTSWGDVFSLNTAKEAAPNVIPDLVNQGVGLASRLNPITAIPQDIQAGLHPIDTIKGIYQHYANYTNPAGAKKNIVEHPVGTALDVASALTAGRGLMRGAIPETVATREAVPNPVIEAANAEGVQIPNVLMKPEGVQNAARKISDYPFAGAPLNKAVKTATTQLGEAKDRIVSGLGSGNADIAGANARQAIGDFVQSPHPDVAQGYSQVESQINPDVRTPLSNTQKVVAEINARREQAGAPALNTQLIDKAIASKGLSYEGIKFLRTLFGEGMKKGEIPSLTKSEGDRIYGALSEDLKQAVGASGGEPAVKTFDYANNLARLHADRRARVAKILGAGTDEGIVDRIVAKASSGTRGDVKTLAVAKSAMPSAAWGDVASSAIQKLGLDKTGDFSPERFLTAYAKISAAGKRILFDSKTRQHLDNIATISTKHGEFERFANRSKTGASVFTAAGFTVSPLVALKAIVGGRAIAHLLSKPATIKYVTRYAKAYTSRNKNAVTQALAGISGLLRGGN